MIFEINNIEYSYCCIKNFIKIEKHTKFKNFFKSKIDFFLSFFLEIFLKN